MIATDVNFEKLKELKQERPAVVIDQLDVTKGTDVERMFKEKYLDVNVLFNCAGCVSECVYTGAEREREKGRKEGEYQGERVCVRNRGRGKEGRKGEDVMEASRTYTESLYRGHHWGVKFWPI